MCPTMGEHPEKFVQGVAVPNFLTTVSCNGMVSRKMDLYQRVALSFGVFYIYLFIFEFLGLR